MDTPVRADGVRNLVIAVHRGDVVLSDSGGSHVEGTINSDAEPRVTHHGGLLKIQDQTRTPTTVRLAIPPGVELKVRARNCDVVVRVPVGGASIGLGSGSVRLGEVGGSLDIDTQSADIDVAATGPHTSLRTGSGDITVGRVNGSLVARTGSGDVSLAANYGEVTIHSGSGDTGVGVPDGVPTWLDLKTSSGAMAVNLPEGEEPDEDDDSALVEIATGSGDIHIGRA